MQNFPTIFEDDLIENNKALVIEKGNLAEYSILMSSPNYSLLETSDAECSHNNILNNQNFYPDDTTDSNSLHQDCPLSTREQQNLLAQILIPRLNDFPKTYINDDFLKQECLLGTKEQPSWSNNNTQTDVSPKMCTRLVKYESFSRSDK